MVTNTRPSFTREGASRLLIKAIYADFMWLSQLAKEDKDVAAAMSSLADTIQLAIRTIHEDAEPFRSIDYS